MKHKKVKNNQGFSLVELIIVIAILAILAGFLAAAYVKHLKEARAAVCLENRDRLYKEMNAKYADGTYDSLKEAYNKLMENYKDFAHRRELIRGKQTETASTRLYAVCMEHLLIRTMATRIPEKLFRVQILLLIPVYGQSQRILKIITKKFSIIQAVFLNMKVLIM